jgi:hypothetical protein
VKPSVPQVNFLTANLAGNVDEFWRRSVAAGFCLCERVISGAARGTQPSITRPRRLLAAAVIPTRTYRAVLVREREDDDEADQHKRDQISIKPIKVFPVEVNTHRMVLLFAEVTLTIRLGCFRSNSAIPIQQRDSNARSTAARLGALHSRDDSGGQSVFAAAARTKAASSLLKRGASS